MRGVGVTVGQRDDEGTVSPPFKQELTTVPSIVDCLLFSLPVRVVLLYPSRRTASVPTVSPAGSFRAASRVTSEKRLFFLQSAWALELLSMSIL